MPFLLVSSLSYSKFGIVRSNLIQFCNICYWFVDCCVSFRVSFASGLIVASSSCHSNSTRTTFTIITLFYWAYEIVCELLLWLCDARQAGFLLTDYWRPQTTQYRIVCCFIILHSGWLLSVVVICRVVIFHIDSLLSYGHPFACNPVRTEALTRKEIVHELPRIIYVYGDTTASMLLWLVVRLLVS